MSYFLPPLAKGRSWPLPSSFKRCKPDVPMCPIIESSIQSVRGEVDN